MKKIAFILVLSTFILSFPKPDNYSIGMSETMGPYGFYNANYYLDDLKPFFITAIKKENFDLYFQFGVITQYSVFGKTIDESPSDISNIWPVINIEISK